MRPSTSGPVDTKPQREGVAYINRTDWVLMNDDDDDVLKEEEGHSIAKFVLYCTVLYCSTRQTWLGIRSFFEGR